MLYLERQTPKKENLKIARGKLPKLGSYLVKSHTKCLVDYG